MTTKPPGFVRETPVFVTIPPVSAANSGVSAANPPESAADTPESVTDSPVFVTELGVSTRNPGVSATNPGESAGNSGVSVGPTPVSSAQSGETFLQFGLAIKPAFDKAFENPDKIMTNDLHVSLGFVKSSDGELNKFAVGVVNGLTSNADLFASPPVAPAALGTAQQAFEAAAAATEGGGEAQTAARDAARETLIGLLRQLALFVQQTAQGDQTKILAAGFQVANIGHHPQSPLAKAVILQIKNEVSGQLLIRLQPEHNAIAYEGQMSTDGGKTWLPAGTYPQARRIVVEGLTPGTSYTFHFRALGGSTGSGDWSDPVTHMAT